MDAVSAPVTVSLDLGAERTRLVVDPQGRTCAIVALAVGVDQLARDFLRHSPPTPHEMEAAIDFVEEAVGPARPRLPERLRLVASGDAIRDIARAAGLAIAPGPAPSLRVDAVERTFNRLVNVVEGNPARHEGVPESASFAAALLVLREVMHHLGIEAVEIA